MRRCQRSSALAAGRASRSSSLRSVPAESSSRSVIDPSSSGVVVVLDRVRGGHRRCRGRACVSVGPSTQARRPRARARAPAAVSNASSPSAGVHPHAVARLELALEQLQRQAVHQPLLDHPLERAGAVGGVVAEVAEQRPGLLGQLDLHPRSRTRAASARHLELHDPADLLARELVELDDLVQPVHELGLEGAPGRPRARRPRSRS